MSDSVVRAVYLRCDEPCKKASWKAVQVGLEQAANCGAKRVLIKISPFIEPDLIAKAVNLSRRLGLSIRVDVPLEDGWYRKWHVIMEKDVAPVLHIPPEAALGASLRVPSSLARHLTVYVSVDGRNQRQVEALVQTLLVSKGVGKVVLCVTMRYGLGPLEYLSVCSRIRALAVQYPEQIWARIPWALLDEDTWRVGRRLCDYSHTIGLFIDGGIVPCGVKRRAEDDIPTVFDARLEEILRFDPLMVRFQKTVLPDEVRGVCRRCVFKKYCANICPAYVYNITGSFANSYPECEQLLTEGMFPERYLLEKSEANLQKEDQAHA